MTDPLSPQWEDCKVCGGGHWTSDHMPSVRPVVIRWHLWYDDYEKGTAFISEGFGADPAGHRIIAEDLPYAEAWDRVYDHNQKLPERET